MSKVVKYTYRLRRYNYTHNQLNILDISVSFLGFFFKGGGGHKIQACPRAPVTLATPLITGFNRGVQLIFPEVYNNDGTEQGRIGNEKVICHVFVFFRWEDAKRAYLKFIDNEIITRHITRNPFTLGYTYSYTLLYTKTHRIYTKLQIVT